MKLPRRKLLRLAAGAVALPALSRIARAQTYPSRPITLVVPAAAGGPTDTITRILAARMRPSLGETLVIENNGAAAGSIAVGRAARAAPDGYTLSIGHVGTHVFNGAIYALHYDLLRDFEPIALLVTNPQLIVGRKEFPAKGLEDLIAWLKANPDKALQGTAGIGSPAHVTGLYFQNKTQTRFQFVPYRGAGPAMQDLLAGHVDLLIDQAANSLPQYRAGTIKVFAVAAKNRLAAAPEILTVDEAGLPGFYASVWHGLWAPNGTPKEIVAKLNASVVEALGDPKIKERFASLGQDSYPREQQTPDALRVFQTAEIAKWWPIIKAAAIKAE